MPFKTYVEIPGAEPGMSARIEIDIEKVIADLKEGEQLIKQIAVLAIHVKVLSDKYKNENRKQILVEKEMPLLPKHKLNIDFKTIVKRNDVFESKQILLDNCVLLPYPAIKIKNIEGKIENVKVKYVKEGLIVVEGFVIKDISYVSLDNIVYHKEEKIPFSTDISTNNYIQAEEINPEIKIENISFSLIDKGKKIRELVVLKVCIKIGKPRFVRVVTSIEGTGIKVETILVREDFLISENPLITKKLTFPVVVKVTDPQKLLTKVVKKIIKLNTLKRGKIPVEVIVFAD